METPTLAPPSAEREITPSRTPTTRSGIVASAPLTRPRTQPWAYLRPRTAAAFSPWLIAVAAVCVGLAVVAATLSGGLAIPHNDAWSMSRIAQTFAATGQIHLLGWNDMNLIGQVVMLGPLGRSVVVQQLAVAGLSVACLACVYRLLAVSLSTGDALLGVLLLGLWPGWASLSTSFETDVPAFAATFAALLLGRRALRRDSLPWLAAALLVSLFAVSIREQAIAAPAAILIYGWCTRRARARLHAHVLLTAAAGLGATLLAFELWRWGLPLGQDPAPTAGPARFVGGLFADGARSYLTLALCLAPAVLIGAARHRWTRRDLVWLGAGFAVAALALVGGGPVGRYLEPAGEYAQVLPGARVVLPAPVWDGLLDLAAVSATLLAPLAWARRRSIDPLLATFTLLAFAEIVAIGATGNGVWDRYLPVLLPGVVTLVLGRAPARVVAARPAAEPARAPAPEPARHPLARPLAAAALVALLALGGVSAALAANGFAFDTARWHAAQQLARTGTPPDRIDAGMEWDGWHSADGMRYGRAHIAKPGGWTLAFSRAPACVALTSSPWHVGPGTTRPRWTPDGSTAYRTYLIAGHSDLYAYSTHAQGCTS